MFFTYVLLYLKIANRGWGIPVDFSKAYEELGPYKDGINTWYLPPVHFLILEKK